MGAEWALWVRHLAQPEYVHVLINPIPLYGTAAGVLGLLLGLIFRSVPAQRVAVVIIGLSCLSVWPVAEYGQRGFDRVKSMSSADAQAWLKQHEDRAEDLEPLFYATAALSLVCLVMPLRFEKINSLLPVAVLVLAVACCLAGGWIAHAGGQIRHAEFREGPPPASHENHDD